jgi:hypothetical protein
MSCNDQMHVFEILTIGAIPPVEDRVQLLILCLFTKSSSKRSTGLCATSLSRAVHFRADMIMQDSSESSAILSRSMAGVLKWWL